MFTSRETTLAQQQNDSNAIGSGGDANDTAESKSPRQSLGPLKLTDIAIQKLKPSKDGSREIPITGHEGLRLVVYSSGKKSFQMRFRRPGGLHGKLVLGTYDPTGKEMKDEPVIGQPLTLAAAHALAATINRDRAKGIDVIETRRAERLRKAKKDEERTASAFGLAAREFVVKYKTRKQRTRPRRWRDDAALLGLKFAPGSDPASAEPKIIKGSVVDIWSEKAVAEIDGHDVHAVVSRAKQSSDGRARKLATVLSTLFTWLKDEQRAVTINPVIGVYRPGPPPSRERVLSDAEIAIFWKATDAVGVPFGAMYRLLLLTGCRLREVTGMRRSELAENGTWNIPATRTKNHRPLSLPLPKLALDIIASVPAIEGGEDFVFTTTGRSPVSGFSKAKKDLDAAMAKIATQPVPPWRVNDLEGRSPAAWRHSASSCR